MSLGQGLFRVQISDQAKSCNSAQRLGNEERRALEACRARLLGSCASSTCSCGACCLSGTRS